MSDRILAWCGDAVGKGGVEGYGSVIDLRQTGSDPNVDLRVTNITSRILRDISQRGRDLLDIATYVYVLDSSVGRGGPYDVYGKRWVRDFTLRIPVRDIGFWRSRRDELEKLLGYLTDDAYTFEFTPHPGDAGQRYPNRCRPIDGGLNQPLHRQWQRAPLKRHARPPKRTHQDRVITSYYRTFFPYVFVRSIQ